MAATAQAGVSIPTFQPDEIRHRRNIAAWSQWVNQGHLQNTGSVTLAAGAGTTVVIEDRCGAMTFIGFMPLTANALSAGPTVRVSSQSVGGFTITHANSAAADKTFRYCILG